MSLTWQDLATLALVAAAVVYLARHAIRRARGKSRSCCGCPQCGPVSRETPPLIRSLEINRQAVANAESSGEKNSPDQSGIST